MPEQRAEYIRPAFQIPQQAESLRVDVFKDFEPAALAQLYIDAFNKIADDIVEFLGRNSTTARPVED